MRDKKKLKKVKKVLDFNKNMLYLYSNRKGNSYMKNTLYRIGEYLTALFMFVVFYIFMVLGNI